MYNLLKLLFFSYFQNFSQYNYFSSDFQQKILNQKLNKRFQIDSAFKKVKTRQPISFKPQPES